MVDSKVAVYNFGPYLHFALERVRERLDFVGVVVHARYVDEEEVWRAVRGRVGYGVGILRHDLEGGYVVSHVVHAIPDDQA